VKKTDVLSQSHPVTRVQSAKRAGLEGTGQWRRLPRRRVTPDVPIPTTPASDGQIFTDFGGRENAVNTRSSAAVLITVTVCVTVCWQNAGLSRMQGSLIILHRCCINFTDFRGASANHLLSWLWSSSSAFVVWRRLPWMTCASPFRRSSAGGSCGRLTAGHSSCHVPGLRSVGETLLCRARPHGTASHSNCGLHHCLLRSLRKKNHLFGC